jgi:hypothetical protein
MPGNGKDLTNKKNFYMRTMIKNLLSFSLLALLISSCGKKTADVLIPENAAMVFHINAASLGSKLTWDEIKNSEWFKMASKENHADDFEKKLLEDPENSGIDLKSDMYFSVHMSGKNSYVVFQGKLKDVKAYESLITKVGDTKEIKKDGSISYTGDKGGLVTWNNDRFIIVGQSAGYFPGNKDLYGDNDEHSITMDSVLKFAKDIYNLKKSKSIGNDSRFASLFNEKGDMHFWINSSSLIQNSMPMGMAGLFDATTLLKGNAVGYTLSFDDGKISASTQSWFNKELGDLMKKYKAGNLNTDMLKKIPGQDVAFVFAMNYPPEGLKEILQLAGVDGIVNGLIGMLGISIDDFVKAMKGDMLFAVSDFNVKDTKSSFDPGNDSMTFTKPEPDAKVLFATSINDKASFDKIADVLKKEISKQGGTEDLDKIKYTVKDNWLIAGNSQEIVDGFAAGKTNEHSFISKISGHPMGGYIDLKKILGSINSKETEEFKNIISGEGNIWDNIIFYGGEMKSGAMTGHFEVNMIDKKTNSLKQFNNYISTIATTYKNKRHQDGMLNWDSPVIDSAIVQPPTK